jgi:hypothetical protein
MDQPRSLSTDECIKKMWSICTMEHYSAIKKNEITSFAGKWMELELIMLSEISQAQKDKGCMFSVMCGTWNAHTHTHNSNCRTVWGMQGRGKRETEWWEMNTIKVNCVYE